MLCHRCHKTLGRVRISYQDLESGIIFFYHAVCSELVFEEVMEEYLQLIRRIMQRRVK